MRIYCIIAPAGIAPLGDQRHLMPGIRLIRNLNLDFNTVWLQMILESIQRIAYEGSPLLTLAQQGAKAANLVAA
jgi:hypothetical protein